MEEMKVTIGMPAQLGAGLATLSRVTGRSEAVLAQEALEHYVEDELRQLAQIEEGWRQAEAGQIVPKAEMDAVFARLTTADALERAREHLMPEHTSRQWPDR